MAAISDIPGTEPQNAFIELGTLVSRLETRGAVIELGVLVVMFE